MSEPLSRLNGDLQPDTLTGRWYSLVPLQPKYYSAIFSLSLRDENNFRWRYRGTVPSPASFEQSLFAGVMTQFVVVPKDNPERLAGLVVAYNASPQDSYCYLAAVMDPKEGAGSTESVALFVRYLFRHWPLRKLYLESAEYNARQYASAATTGLLVEEGRLKNHSYFNDRYWDHIIFALYRDAAATYESRFSSIFLD